MRLRHLRRQWTTYLNLAPIYVCILSRNAFDDIANKALNMYQEHDHTLLWGMGFFSYAYVLGWFKLCSGVPKVFISTSIVIFPIPYAQRTTTKEKN